jgi:hypothetical protein
MLARQALYYLSHFTNPGKWVVKQKVLTKDYE